MKIEEFISNQFGTVRTITEDETIWFLAKDVAKALGYKNERDAIRTHTFESDRKRLIYKACRESRQANIRSLLWSGNDFSDKVLINESGLYCLIFGSNLESAEEFKLWVTSTVLPSIRRNGGYIEGQEELSEADQKELATQVKELSKKVAKLQARRHELIKERDMAKSKLRNRKQEVKALNEYAEIFESLYFDLVKEYRSLKAKLRPQAVKKTPVIIPQKTYRVDAEGFLI